MSRSERFVRVEVETFGLDRRQSRRLIRRVSREVLMNRRYTELIELRRVKAWLQGRIATTQ